MAEATTDTIDAAQSTLSPNFADYIYRMLARGEQAAGLPFQAYTGQRYADTQPLLQKAFDEIKALGSPEAFQSATDLAGKVGEAAGKLSYTASGLPAYDKLTSGYVAPNQYETGIFTNQFISPEAYEAAKFDTGLGAVKDVESYMSPYMSGVAAIAAREAKRTADIARQSEQARLAKAGAYGGSRQAIMEAERQRNLGTQVEDIYTKGLQSAYDRAVEQRLKESGLSLEAQKATEASRQFGATQGMTAAELQAKYGLSADQAREASRQFGATQAMTAAENTARYQQAAEKANQDAALEAARQAEASKQFGAKYGLDALQQQLSAAQQLGSIGAQQAAATQGIAGLQLKAGQEQQQLAQQPFDFGYQQFQDSMKYPFQQATYMQSLLSGLPLAAAPYNSGTSGFGGALQGLALGAALTGGIR